MPVAVVWQFLLPLALVVAIGLFVLGFVWPRRSREAANDVAGALAVAERRTSRGSVVGPLAAKLLGRSRRAARKSARAGRKARKRADGRRSR